MLRERQRDAAQVHAERTRVKTGVHEEAGHGMRGDGLAVDGGDEHAMMTGGMHALLAPLAEEVREACGSLRALGLVGRKKDEDVGVVAAEPGDETAVAKNDFSIGGASEHARA